MNRKLKEELIGKTVMSPGGSILGTLEELVVDTETGEIRFLLLRVSNQTRAGSKMDAKGRAVYAVNKMTVNESTITISS